MLLSAVSAALLFLGLTAALFSTREAAKGRLQQIRDMAPASEEEDEYRKPFTDRIIKPLYHGFLEFLASLTPRAMVNRYNDLIIQAGKQTQTTPIRIIGQQILLAVFLWALMFFLLPRSTNRRALLLLCIFLIALVVPYLLLAQKAKQRLTLVNRSLPDLLDLLYVSVEAGLGFDLALKRTSEKMRGPLSDEILLALGEITKGRERESALRGIADRTKSTDLSSFITSVIQTEQLGSNISNTLRVQSTVMRQKRKQRAEEQAAKLSTKMLFPIVFFIFPTIFVILLGPTLLNMIETLAGVF